MNSSKNLMKVIKNPITDHIPKDITIIALTSQGDISKPSEYLEKFWEIKDNIAIIVPTSIHSGKLQNQVQFAFEKKKFSSFALTPSATLSRLLVAGETVLGLE